MAFFAPIDGTITSSDAYDVVSEDPADWLLRVALEGTDLQLRACFSGIVSTAPPCELPRVDLHELAPLPAPADLPPTASLYLRPFEPETIRALVDVVAGASLGTALRWIVFHNVDTAGLGADLRARLADDPWKTADELQAAFVLGYRDAVIYEGETLGLAAGPRVEIGVMTDDGYVDPETFFEALAGRADGDEAAALAALVAAVPKGWPELSSIDDAKVRLYPIAVLAALHALLGGSDATWDEIRVAQKALYWSRLVAGTFRYLADDLANPFALEAVVELLMAWPEPASDGSAPLAVPDPEVVDLNDGQPQLVLIDPFSHARLGSPALPGPGYALSPVGAITSPCDATSPASLGPDTYDGVLFLVYGGRVLGWYRWSSYTGRRYESTTHGNCAVSRSIVGNRKYWFDSYVSSESTGRNLSFRIADDDAAADTTLAARHYFRTGMPSGTQTNVRLHNGQCHDSHNTSGAWSGSEGCLVSPSYYLMRSQLVGAYLAERGPNHGLETVSAAVTGASSGALLSDAQATTAWRGTFKGPFWLIHPDEPTRKE